MKMNDEVLKFTLSSEDEEYEEEIIERDEFVDGEYDDYDEEEGDDDYEYNEEDEYEDGYDDEGYDEEEYYDDEEPYDEYDEEPYEDEKLNRVLAELADLRRAVSTPGSFPPQQPAASPVDVPPPAAHPLAVPPPVVFPPQSPSSAMPFVFAPQNNHPSPNNDILTYNEISKLRSELGKTQVAQEMHAELARLKDQMATAAKLNETNAQAEIRRLNEKLAYMRQDNLNEKLANTQQDSRLSEISHAQSVPPPTQSVPQAQNEEVLRREFEKLLLLNEAILNVVRDSDARISTVRKKVSALPNFAELSKNVEELRQTISTLPPPNVTVQAAASAPLDVSSLLSRIDSLDCGGCACDNSEILRQIYELKSLVGASDAVIQKRNSDILALYNDFNRVKFDADSKSVPLSDKLIAIEEFAKKLSVSGEPEAWEIYQSLLQLAQRILSIPLDKNSVSAISDFVSVSGVSIPSNRIEAGEVYARIFEKKKSSPSEIAAQVEELVTAIDIITDYANTDGITAEALAIKELAADYETQKKSGVLAQIRSKFAGLCNLTALDMARYEPLKPPRSIKTSTAIGIALAEKLDKLQASLTSSPESAATVDSEAHAATVDNEIRVEDIVNSETHEATVDNEARADTLPSSFNDDGSNDKILAEIKALKEEICTVQTGEDILDAMTMVKHDTLEILAHLASKNLDAGSDDSVYSVDENDIAYIKNKLHEQDKYLSQIADLRREVASILRGDTYTEDSVERSTVAAESTGDAEHSTLTAESATDDVERSVATESTDDVERSTVAAESAGDVERSTVASESVSDEEGNTVAESVNDAERSAVAAEPMVDIAAQLNVLYEDLANAMESYSSPITQQLTDVTLKLTETSVDVSDIHEISRSISTSLAELKDFIMQDGGSVSKRSSEEDSANSVKSEALTNELGEMKSMLENRDSLSKEETDAIQNQMMLLLEEMQGLKDNISTSEYDQTEANINEESAQLMLSDISDSLRKILYGMGEEGESDNVQLLITDLAEVKEKIANIDEILLVGLTKISDDIDNISVAGVSTKTPDEIPLNNITPPSNDELLQIIEDIAAIKDRVVYAYEEQAKELAKTKEDICTLHAQESADVKDRVNTVLEDMQQLKADIAALANLSSDMLISDSNTFVDDENRLVNRNAILKELSVIREEVCKDTIAAATSEELNLLVNEVASLREEMSAYRNEIHSRQTSTEKEEVIESVVDDTTAETMLSLMDEVNALRGEVQSYNEEILIAHKADYDTLCASIEEIKNCVNRTGAMKTENEAAASIQDTATVVVLEEVVSLKESLAGLRQEMEDIRAEQNNALATEMQSIKEMLYQLTAHKQESNSVVDDVIGNEQHNTLLSEFAELKNQLYALSDSVAKVGEAASAMSDKEPQVELVQQLDEKGEPLIDEKGEPVYLKQPIISSDEAELARFNILYEEIVSLKTQELQDNDTEKFDLLFSELNELKDQVSTLALVVNESISASVATVDTSASGETAEKVQTVLGEIVELSNKLSIIESSVRSLSDEPDMGVVTEIMALRDEFQAFKDEMVSTKYEKETNEAVYDADKAAEQSSEEVLNEIRQLRDQLFAVSMAGVSSSDNPNASVEYESYNNIILDEITALKAEFEAARAEIEATRLEVENSKNNSSALDSVVEAVSSELSIIKDSLSGNKDIALIKSELSVLAGDIERIRENSVSIESLKEDISASRDANEALVNFMSGIASVVENQSKQFAHSAAGANEKLSNANALLLEKIEVIRKEMANNAAKPIVSVKDNEKATQAVLKEIAKLKDELAKEKPGDKKVLTEIQKLKNEIGVLVDRGSQETSRDLDRSLDALKAELNQINDYLSQEESVATVAIPAKKPAIKPKQKSAASKKFDEESTSAAKMPANKKPAAKKPVAKLASDVDKTPTAKVQKINTSDEIYDAISDIGYAHHDSSELSQEDMRMTNELLEKITKESNELVHSMKKSEVESLEVDNEMDLAERLARQVANKLVMEQLVQQLGDGGVPQSKVEEIVKEILPQEFTTIQIDAQSDHVRRLANDLVLDKLRARLTGK